jgi:predicted permease
MQQQPRRAPGVRWIESILSDLRFGLRHFRRKPVAAATMVVVMALGIGFSLAVFLLLYSFVNGPPPGVVLDESVARIRGIDRSRGPERAIGREFSYVEYREYAAQQDLFSAVAAWTSSDAVLDVGTVDERLHSGAATFVTASYFSVLGLRPVLGVGLPTDAADEAGAPQLVGVISHVVWERYFDRAPDVVGRSMKVNGVRITIAGVAPRRFAGARTGGSHVRVWLPLNARPIVQRGAAFDLMRDDSAIFGLLARLESGAEIERTIPAVEAIASRINQHTSRPGARTADVVTLRADNYFPPSGETPGIAGRVVALMFPLIILLITCTNVSALQAGLAIARRREISVRLSLGASRPRVVRQLVTETVLLALAAGALALFVVWILWRAFDASIPDLELVLDWRAFAFTFGLSVATGIVFGLSPALHGTRLALSEVIKDTGGALVASRSRLQSGLVVAQIAFTQPALLLMGAQLLSLTTDLRALPSQPFADRILEVRFNTNPRYGALDEKREEALRRLQARLQSVPGVAGVVPQETGEDDFDVAVHPADRVADLDIADTLNVRARVAPAGYFALMGIPIIRGRDFTAAERSGGNAVMIGADLARDLWGSADPIGRRFLGAGPNRRNISLFEVVGVVEAPTATRRDASNVGRRIFVPDVGITGHFLIRTHGPAEPVLPAIRSVATTEAPELPIVSAQTLAAIEAGGRRSIRTGITAAGGSGSLALLLSAIGLYAVVAFAVGQRVREIGIRTALGAGRRQVVGMFLFRGLRLCAAGLLVGLTLSLVAVRLMAVAQGEDPPAGTLWLAALVAAVVIGVAMLATWIPARRAAEIDPLRALRVE